MLMFRRRLDTCHAGGMLLVSTEENGKGIKQK